MSFAPKKAKNHKRGKKHRVRRSILEVIRHDGTKYTQRFEVNNDAFAEMERLRAEDSVQFAVVRFK